jgi:hypothetical protein
MPGNLQSCLTAAIPITADRGTHSGGCFKQLQAPCAEHRNWTRPLRARLLPGLKKTGGSSAQTRQTGRNGTAARSRDAMLSCAQSVLVCALTSPSAFGKKFSFLSLEPRYRLGVQNRLKIEAWPTAGRIHARARSIYIPRRIKTSSPGYYLRKVRASIMRNAQARAPTTMRRLPHSLVASCAML